MFNYLLAFLSLLALLENAKGIEDYELDLYDLVEEVNGTFYEFMELERECSTSDVRRAYRKLSLILHPDKNKNDDAELMFRQLAGIYEILKSSEKRERYNDILVNGLPTWRQPLYYYRKVRKFGFTESSIVLVIIASIIHYAMIWAAFWEKKYEIEEVFQGRMKKGTKRKNHQDYNDDLEEAMEAEIARLVKPNLSHLLVCQVVLTVVRLVVNTPGHVKRTITDLIKERMNPPVDVDDDNEEDGKETKKKIRCDEVFSNMATPEMAAPIKPVVYQEAVAPISDNAEKKPTAAKKAHWTDADDSKLARAMQKFPAGTALRWEKIAQQLNHSPAEIISRAKQLKTRQYNVVGSGEEHEPTKLPEIKKKAADCRPQGGISLREEILEPESAESIKPVAAEWSQLQQKSLESALASVPKTAPDRWGDIAALVPGKTKVECMVRYKHLASVIRQRKLNTASAAS